MIIPPNHPFWQRLSIINHPFWGTPIFGKTHMDSANMVTTVVSLRLSSRPPHCLLMTVGCKDLHPGNVMVKSWSEIVIWNHQDPSTAEMIWNIMELYLSWYTYTNKNSLHILWQILSSITLLLYMTLFFISQSAIFPWSVSFHTLINRGFKVIAQAVELRRMMD